MDIRPAEIRFTILVPNWNGEPFLRRGLGSLLLAARAAGGDGEILVVDDASQDGGPALIEAEFPAVRLIRRAENGGFGRAVNQGVAAARGEIALLVNNDVIVREGMADPDVFAVSAKTIDWDRGEPNHVAMHAVWREGLLAEDFTAPEERTEASYAQGGACAVRRSEFLAMGGFAEVFAPGYWEDYDLSYWARKRGLRVLYDPKAIAHHLGKASLGARYGRENLEILRRRNQILFTWINLSDPALWARHLAQFPWAAARSLVRDKDSTLAKGLLRALPRLGAALAARRGRRATFRLADRDIVR